MLDRISTEDKPKVAQVRQGATSIQANNHELSISEKTYVKQQSTLLSDEALDFICFLEKKFKNRRSEILINREIEQDRINKGKLPDFDPETLNIRETSWKIKEIPENLQNRQVEITGPTDAKMMINALNSNAQIYMADLEDSCSPKWEEIIQGQINLTKAVRKNLTFTNDKGKEYKLKDKIATLMVRPRGWHLDEQCVRLDNKTISASLWDYGLFLFHNFQCLIENGAGPYFYLPKIEHYREASLWSDVFSASEEYLNIPSGTIKATVLIETLPAAFQINEIIYELKNYITGLNAGRWDYIFSYIKRLQQHKEYTLPTRQDVKMTCSFMQAYTKELVTTCHRRGAHAIGGMSAFIPNRKLNNINEIAISEVRKDKQREAELGFDGSWVAHPDLVPVVKEVFETHLKPRVHQKHVINSELKTKQEDLISSWPNKISISDNDISSNIRVSLLYLQKWLQGTGAVAIDNLMEDTATAEICRAQLWQWLKHASPLEAGGKFNIPKYKEIRTRVYSELQGQNPSDAMANACEILDNLVLSPIFPEFLTNESTSHLYSEPKKEGWDSIKRPYSKIEVEQLTPSIKIEYTLAKVGAKKFWKAINSQKYIKTFGAMTGSQAVNMVKGGLSAIYVSGWQVAADANLSTQTYPDQSLYPANSVPNIVKRLQNALLRADQIEKSEGLQKHDWFVPIVADAEAGFGGHLNSFELMKNMIEAGAAAVHFEDQLAAEKKCGHLGGKVLVPTSQFIKTLISARLAADICEVPTVIIARTDALAAKLITSDIDPRDKEFLTGKRSPEGFFFTTGGINSAISRGLAYAPYADIIWFETSTPCINEAKTFAHSIRSKFPNKPLAYNCSPSFNWNQNLSPDEISEFQNNLAELGYKFQFITLAGWHLNNFHTFSLAKDYAANGMSAYAKLQQKEFDQSNSGYTAVRHQREVGAAYFDKVLNTITQGDNSTSALKDSTETEQFYDKMNP